MTAEIGHFALALAFALTLIGASLPLYGASRGRPELVAVARPVALGQFALIGLAFVMLTLAYLASDFSVVNVALNSHTVKPLLYKLSGVWGNHEGSLLLWALILSLFAAAVALFGGELPDDFRARVLSVQSMIAAGFLAFMLFTSNPFLRLDPAPMQGQGLNPLLQDPGLAFHPPMLYLGYVGFSIAFSFAIAALLEGKVTPAWARWVRPWTLAAWMFLTGGIALGSWWAYYELGWGGWWFWDPVENASLMPWIAGTALLHSVIVVEKRESLKSWSILLAIMTFSFSLLGTFLVRSGVLTSVHAFATDPARGVFILGFLIAVVGGAFTLYAVRAPALRSESSFAPVSREGGLVINNLLLAVAAGIVLLGTLAPLLLDAFAGYKVSVAAPFFNLMTVAMAPFLFVVMGFGPTLAWKKADLGRAAKRLRWAALAALIAAAVTLFALPSAPWTAVLGMTLGTWLVAAILTDLAGRLGLGRDVAQSITRLKGLRRSVWGVALGHFGMAVTLFGITASEAWTEEKLTFMSAGDTAVVAGYSFAFDGAEPVAGPNYTAIRGHFRVSRGGNEVAVLTPEERTYTSPEMLTTEAAIRPLVLGDLYAVIGQPNSTGAWAVRLYFKPLVSWIWAGALLMMIGGVFSLSDRQRAPGRQPAAAGKLAPQPAE